MSYSCVCLEDTFPYIPSDYIFGPRSCARTLGEKSIFRQIHPPAFYLTISTLEAMSIEARVL